MDYREKINCILSRKNTGSSGLWLGQPVQETETIYIRQLGFTSFEEVRLLLRDHCRWIMADGSYHHPDNKSMFYKNVGLTSAATSNTGYFADCTNVSDVHKYPWPRLEYLDFFEVMKQIDENKPYAVFSGFWNCFFHFVSDFFGMENYFIKMYTDPDVVDAVTAYVLDFLEEANDRFLSATGDSFDIAFMGNDLGTQRDLLMSPEMTRRFFLPGLKRLIHVAKKHNKKVMIHSCGSIYKIIPDLIDLGIDGLHPLQAKAANMDAATLAREFKNDLAFIGGIDTQDLLVHGTPLQVKDEVYRIRELFGPNLIVSPSHEGVLPNVPLENIIAMAEAAIV